MKAVLPTSAARLWPLVRWDGDLLGWYPGATAVVIEGAEKGDVRRISLDGGAVLVQRLDHLSRIEDAYTFSVLGGPYPVADYLAQIRVLPGDDGHATLVWTANFQPDGASEDAAEVFIRHLYQTGFDNLFRLLADPVDREGSAWAGHSNGPNTQSKGVNRP